VGRKKKEKKVLTKEEAAKIHAEVDRRVAVKKREEELTLYSDGQPYDKVRVIGETKFFLTETATSIFEAGRRLVWIKEKEGHGEWMRILAEEIGISEPTAWRMMAIARKLSNSSRVKDFAIRNLKHGIGKLYALLDVPDEDLKLFEDTGSLLGKPQDEVDRMSVKELRDLVRGHRDRKKTWEENLQKKDQKITGLQNEIYGLQLGLGLDEAKEFEKLTAMKMAFNSLWYRMDTADLSKASDRFLTEFLNFCEYMHDLSKLLFLRKDNQFNRMDSQRATDGEVNDQEVKVIRKYPQVYAGKVKDAGDPTGSPLQEKNTAGEGMPS
jgi:hypothetical protein